MSYQSKLRDPFIDDLFEGILLLKDEQECYRFFEDLCTVAELKSMAQRLEVAKMLKQDATYTATLISKQPFNNRTLKALQLQGFFNKKLVKLIHIIMAYYGAL